MFSLKQEMMLTKESIPKYNTVQRANDIISVIRLIFGASYDFPTGFIYLLAMLQTWLVSMLFGYYVLPAVGMAVPAFTSYLAHKRWSFR